MATRTKQRARTKQAITEAVGRLLDVGATAPTVDDIADAAEVSRATFYRYFESAQDAVWSVFADRDLPDPHEAVAAAGDDVVERVLAAERVVNDFLFADADGARAFERAVLDRSLRGAGRDDDRPARRMRYIDAALAPIADHLSSADLDAVRHALALAMGTQVVPALLDTCRLDPASARVATQLACRSVVTEALRLAGWPPDHAPREGLQMAEP